MGVINKPLEQFIKDGKGKLVKPITRPIGHEVPNLSWFRVASPITKKGCAKYKSNTCPPNAMCAAVMICEKPTKIHLKVGDVIQAVKPPKYQYGKGGIQTIAAIVPMASYTVDGVTYQIPMSSLVDSSAEEAEANVNKAEVKEQTPKNNLFTTKNLIIGAALIGVGVLISKKLIK